MTDIKIGKNAIENLTIGMYEESKIIYREYIQNAADQIDKAVKSNLFDERMFIDIKIDSSKRRISIKDNATGIPQRLVAEKLADVADSDKEKGKDKGFRGIGRLGGLAYCDKLKFITTSKGENVKTIMTWNAKELINMINDNSNKDDASTVLQKTISYDYEECSKEEHYFIVELEGIRSENSELLDIEEVRKYISINAPIPYGSKLIYKSKIKDYLQEINLPSNEYTIYVNEEIITKPYTTCLYENSGGKKKKYDEIYDIKIEEFKRDNGELLAWMWYGISSFIKRIPSSFNEMAGIRIRQSNIQIGDENTLVKLFKEDRGNFYFIGEIHAIHKELVPNARRDYFNENQVRNELEAQLEYYFKDFHQLYHDANKAKSAYKKDIQLKEIKQTFAQKNGKFVSDDEKKKLEQSIVAAREEREKGKRELTRLKDKAKINPVLEIVLKHVEENYEKDLKEKGLHKNIDNKQQIVDKGLGENDSYKKKGNYLVDDLSNLNDKQRKLVSRIYIIIRNNLPELEGTALINKIQEELKR